MKLAYQFGVRNVKANRTPLAGLVFIRRRRRYGEGHPGLAVGLHNLGVLLGDQRRYEEATMRRSPFSATCSPCAASFSARRTRASRSRSTATLPSSMPGAIYGAERLEYEVR